MSKPSSRSATRGESSSPAGARAWAPESTSRGTMRRAPGFTLIEVIVVITVTAIIAIAVYLTVSAAIASAQRSRAVQLEARTQRNARMVLTALLRSARADIAPEDRFKGVSDELRLVGALGFPFARYPAGEPLRVHIWLSAPPARALILELAPWPGRDGGGGGGAQTPSCCSLAWTARRSPIATLSAMCGWMTGIAPPHCCRPRCRLSSTACRPSLRSSSVFPGDPAASRLPPSRRRDDPVQCSSALPCGCVLASLVLAARGYQSLSGSPC